MGSIYVICSRQCPNGDGIYTLLYALYKYSTSITNQPTNDDIFKRTFLNENFWFLTKISLKFVPKGLIVNNPALV